MKQERFEDLLESMSQAAAIARGDMPPSRVFEYDTSDNQTRLTSKTAPHKLTVEIDADLLPHFKTPEQVNAALRKMLHLEAPANP